MWNSYELYQLSVGLTPYSVTPPYGLMEYKSPNSGDVSSSGLDFRSSDDAWYGVRLFLRDETLIIKYNDLSDEFNDRFNAGDLKSAKEVEDFAERFRPTSAQLQDRECYKVIEGMPVCVSYRFSEYDTKFYDAIVEAVDYKEHIFAKDEEVCKCTFVVFWEHGPNAGTKTSTSVEHICLLQPGNARANPVLAGFIKTSREKFGIASHDSGFIAENDVLVCEAATSHKRARSTVDGSMKSTSCKSHTCHLKETKKLEFQYLSNMIKDQGHRRQKKKRDKRKEEKRCDMNNTVNSTVNGQHSIHWERSGLDLDLGGKSLPTDNLIEVGFCHFILIENLEKDLVPSTIVDFIRRHISISSQAHVFPCLSSESYTRGTISVDSQEKLLKLSDFLYNPAHIILSSRGRPWVITEKELRRNAVGAAIGNLKSDSKSPCDKNLKLGSKIKIATSGTDEYKKGKELMELFMEFAVHIKQLHNKLASEERKIMQSSEIVVA